MKASWKTYKLRIQLTLFVKLFFCCLSPTKSKIKIKKKAKKKTPNAYTNRNKKLGLAIALLSRGIKGSVLKISVVTEYINAVYWEINAPAAQWVER